MEGGWVGEGVGGGGSAEAVVTNYSNGVMEEGSTHLNIDI